MAEQATRPRRAPAAKPDAAATPPTLGRVVIYQDKLGPRAAIVTATVAELDPSEQLPVLASLDHVHLMVLAPAGPRPAWNVAPASGGVARVGTWHWPPRV